MIDILTTAGVRRMLDVYGLRPKKALGQNFLVDRQVRDRILENVTSSDVCLEIGCGAGA